MAKSAPRRTRTYSQDPLSQDEREEQDAQSRIDATSNLIGSGEQSALSSREASNLSAQGYAADFLGTAEGEAALKKLGEGEFKEAGKAAVDAIKAMFTT